MNLIQDLFMEEFMKRIASLFLLTMTIDYLILFFQ